LPNAPSPFFLFITTDSTDHNLTDDNDSSSFETDFDLFLHERDKRLADQLDGLTQHMQLGRWLVSAAAAAVHNSFTRQMLHPARTPTYQEGRRVVACALADALHDWYVPLMGIRPLMSDRPTWLGVCDVIEYGQFFNLCAPGQSRRSQRQKRTDAAGPSCAHDAREKSPTTTTSEDTQRRETTEFEPVWVDSHESFIRALEKRFPTAWPAVRHVLRMTSPQSIVLAGGSVMAAIQEEPYRVWLPGSDLDLWIMAPDDVALIDTLRHVLTLLVPRLRRWTLKTTPSVLTFVSPDREHTPCRCSTACRSTNSSSHRPNPKGQKDHHHHHHHHHEEEDDEKEEKVVATSKEDENVVATAEKEEKDITETALNQQDGRVAKTTSAGKDQPSAKRACPPSEGCCCACGQESDRESIQIILTNNRHPVDVISTYGLTYTCAYYDMARKRIMATWGCLWSMMSRYVRPLSNRVTKSFRAKVSAKGFQYYETPDGPERFDIDVASSWDSPAQQTTTEGADATHAPSELDNQCSPKDACSSDEREVFDRDEADEADVGYRILLATGAVMLPIVRFTIPPEDDDPSSVEKNASVGDWPLIRDILAKASFKPFSETPRLRSRRWEDCHGTLRYFGYPLETPMRVNLTHPLKLMFDIRPDRGYLHLCPHNQQHMALAASIYHGGDVIKRQLFDGLLALMNAFPKSGSSSSSSSSSSSALSLPFPSSSSSSLSSSFYKASVSYAQQQSEQAWRCMMISITRSANCKRGAAHGMRIRTDALTNFFDGLTQQRIDLPHENAQRCYALGQLIINQFSVKQHHAKSIDIQNDQSFVPPCDACPKLLPVWMKVETLFVYPGWIHHVLHHLESMASHEIDLSRPRESWLWPPPPSPPSPSRKESWYFFSVFLSFFSFFFHPPPLLFLMPRICFPLCSGTLGHPIPKKTTTTNDDTHEDEE